MVIKAQFAAMSMGFSCLFVGAVAEGQTPALPSSKTGGQVSSDGATRTQGSRRLKIPELWQTVEKATNQSLSQRRKFAANLHELLSKTPSDKNIEQSNIYAALSVLHASDTLLMHSSLSFLAAAVKIWPGFVSTKESLYVWNQLLEYMRRKQIVNEHLLSRAAAILAPGLVATSEVNEFPYYMGWSYFREAKYGDALGILERVPLGSPHYRRAKFLEATSQVLQGRIADARENFQIVVSLEPTQAEDDYGIPRRSIQRIRDLSVINIARILYEQSQFKESLAYYRSADQDSYFFYEAISEQGWSFFMAGYPARALGAAYAATSPFFSDRFNPDVYFLISTLYFWMCHYDYSKQALTAFIAHSRAEGDSLRQSIASIQKLPAARKRERLIGILDALDKGLSAKNFGIGERTMSFLASQEGLMDSYQGYLALRARRLRVQELNLEKVMHGRVQTAIEEFEEELASQVALQAEDALIGLREDYENALSQSRLLWLELLTAQKDKILGQERTVQGNQFVGDEKSFLDALGRSNEKSWFQDKNEFWYDELNSYVFNIQSQCVDDAPAGTPR
jgi:tetratricopeptide (TPR) repeat protein